jgi:Tfp pilus assembly protein FimT
MSVTKRNGYTIIELISVFILLLLIAVPFMTYINFENIRTDFVVRAYVSDIRYVYNKNTFGDIDCYLRYIYSSDMKNNEPIGYYVYERNSAKKTIYFPQNIKMTNESQDFLKFNTSGVLSFKGETVNIENTNNKDRYRITIVPMSGRVAVYRNEK